MSIDLKDLPKVIRACKANGVTELKIGDVEIKFAAVGSAEPEIPVLEAQRIPTPEELKAAESAALLQRNVEQNEEELAHMHIEDPSGFEQRLIEREFENSGDAHNR